VPPRYVGWFFLWTSGIHVGIVAAGTDFYRHFADQALVPGLSAAWRSAYMSHATAGGLTVAAGEALLGLLLLSPAWARRRWGWAGTIAFHVALMCFGWGFWLWCLPALALLVPGARADRTTPDGPGSSRPMTVARRVR
jgi:hypothetical protein